MAKELDPGLMTEKTKQRLEMLLQELKQKIKQNQKDAGSTFESAQDWHDNGAYDILQQQLQVLVTQHDKIFMLLHQAKIIQKKVDTHTVGIGNTVMVQYKGERDSEKFTILGISDTDTEKSWISAASPLGSALLGKNEGESVFIQQNIEVVLLKILAGEF